MSALREGYLVRHSALADVPDIEVLLDAVETSDTGEPRRYGVDVAAEFRDERMELTTNTWVAVAPDGGLAGFASLFWGASMQGEAEPLVHPDHRGRGVIEALIDAIERRASALASTAPSGVRPRLHVVCAEGKTKRRAVLLERGYRALRDSYLMRIDLADEPIEPTALPPGVDVRCFVPGRDDEVVHAASQEAFADHFLFEPATLAQWRLHTVGHSHFDPTLWLVAWAGDEVAGESLTFVDEYEAYVDSLAVRRQWRGRGLGLALLTRSFERAQQRGLRKVRLGVDAQNPTGALALYLKSGMHIERREEVYVKDFSRPENASPTSGRRSAAS